MVSHRCKMLVKEELDKIGLHAVSIELGEVIIAEDISMQQSEILKTNLLQSGLELMDDNKAILIEKIKNVIVEMIHHSGELPETNFSGYISGQLGYNYTYLANLFSETTGITIERFIITHKIERVKELIIYDEFNLSQIAYKMHYSSPAHLSKQFKKATGLTPSFFKSLKQKKRTVLENV